MVFDRRRVYQCGQKRSRSLPSLMPKACTIKRQLAPYAGHRRVTDTVFREIKLVPPEKTWNQDTRVLIRQKVDRRQIAFKEFAEKVMAAMEASVHRTWKSDYFHVILHSSGADSRLLGLAVRRLFRKFGSKWLGDVLFLEFNGEDPSFRRIMQKENWRRNQWHIYREKASPGEKHEPSFDFADAWRVLNGYSGFPINSNWTPLQVLHEQGIIPRQGRTQVYGGWGANEVANTYSDKLGLTDSYSFCYYHPNAHLPLWGRRVYPFVDPEFVRAYVSISKGQPKNYRNAVVNHFAPGLASIPRLHSTYLSKHGYRTLSKRLFERCVEEYRASWLGSRIEVTPCRVLKYRLWWLCWSLASFCEHLRASGHTVRIA